ncbi:MAG TPA: VOC family protein [Gaiellaceae bacterium]|nr:VOC family protein [Gaiellaceae bacterium]
MRVKYVALFVPDLRAAEAFYAGVFGMALRFREAEVDGVWRTLPPEKGWADARAAGIELGLVALERDGFVLALLHGSPFPGTLHEISIGLAPEELATLRERLPASADVFEERPDHVRFRDPFGFRWQAQAPDAPFRSSGEMAGRWLRI